METKFGAIKVESIDEHKFKPGRYQAQIRQSVKTIYPSGVIGNSLSDNLFSKSDFTEITSQEFEGRGRVTWIPVPAKVAKKANAVDLVQAELDKHPKARITRVMGDEPMLTAEQKSAIASPELDYTYDQAAESQLAKYGPNNDAGKDKDEPILWNGKPFYRALFFHIDAVEDEDNRGISSSVTVGVPASEQEKVVEVVTL